MSVLTFLKFLTFRYSHHSKNSRHHLNQFELVVPKMYDTLCLSVSHDIHNIYGIPLEILNIPDIPTIPGISINIQLSWRV